MRLLTCLFLLFLALPAEAATPRQTFDALNACVKKDDAPACREQVTASSVELYDRFAGYGLLHCLPQDAAYISEKKSGAHRLVRAQTGEGMVRLLFVEEEGAWKLDVPETLHTGLGPKWRQRVNAIEQVYVMMKTKLGSRMNCALVQGLAK